MFRLLSVVPTALVAASAALGQATTNPAQTGTAAPPEPTLKAAAPREGWWNDVVFYEVFVRSFADSATGPLANDGIGDLSGLTSRLDYLKDLGVGALWLMPIMQSPSYHGYDTTDYRTVESDYGTNDDFKRLMAACRQRNIRVVIDLVPNHCSDEHPWFKEALRAGSPKHDWFIWSDTRPAWKGPWNQRVWHANPDKEQSNFYYGMFNHDMPDLNYRNPGATKEMRDTAAFWLTEMGADGFRLDAIRHLIEDGQVQENTPETHAWLRGFQEHCKSVSPACFTVGEVWSDTASIARYVSGGEMDSAFEFELESKLVEAVKTGRARPLAAAVGATWSAFPPGTAATFLTNHDQARIMTMLKGDAIKARTAASILLTLPGIPFVYYGEEIGMTGDKPDPKIRTPMQWSGDPKTAGFTAGTPWQAPNADAPKVNVAVQTGVEGSLLSHYKRLIGARNHSPALRRGRIEIIEQADPEVLAFTRVLGDEAVLVAINLGGAAKSRAALDHLERLRCIDTAINLMTGRPEPDWRTRMIHPGAPWIARMGCGPVAVPGPR